MLDPGRAKTKTGYLALWSKLRVLLDEQLRRAPGGSPIAEAVTVASLRTAWQKVVDVATVPIGGQVIGTLNRKASNGRVAACRLPIGVALPALLRIDAIAADLGGHLIDCRFRNSWRNRRGHLRGACTRCGRVLTPSRSPMRKRLLCSKSVHSWPSRVSITTASILDAGQRNLASYTVNWRTEIARTI